jgi:signal transduction histidine kinase
VSTNETQDSGLPLTIAQATLDALAAHICVLDRNGWIILTNRAWQQYAANNCAGNDTTNERVNYLDVCDVAGKGGCAEAGEFAQGIRDVMSGNLSHFSLEYPCHTPTEECWFTIEGNGHVAIIHENITIRKQAELKALAAREDYLEVLHKLVLMNTELEQRVEEKVKESQEKDRVLMQAEKMNILGQLAAGVAHEINNPVGYISSNLQCLNKYFEAFGKFDRFLEEICSSLEHYSIREFIANSKKDLDIAHFLADGPELIKESLDGAEQVKSIVMELKNFSRKDGVEKQPILLSTCLDRALTITHNELKYVATVLKEYDSAPTVFCHPGQINQVFVNLLVNAGQALTAPGKITVKIRHDENFVYGSVSDTGDGISEDVRARIFDMFFTTKEEGKGTGLGLSISKEIIKNHGGDITVESEVGKGTTFTVSLPSVTDAA